MDLYVFQLHVFATSTFTVDFGAVLGENFFQDSGPVLHLGSHAQFFKHNLIQTFFHQQQRYVIDGFINALNDRTGCDVAETCSLVRTESVSSCSVRHTRIWLNTWIPAVAG